MGNRNAVCKINQQDTLYPVKCLYSSIIDSRVAILTSSPGQLADSELGLPLRISISLQNATSLIKYDVS
jgi:hypothetical protein